ncbi:MAG: hypothetical protein ABJE66_34770 [Deltaproteobacteria bacterium]
MLLTGPDGSGRRSLVTAIAREHSSDVIAVDVRDLAAKPATIGRKLRILVREIGSSMRSARRNLREVEDQGLKCADVTT